MPMQSRRGSQLAADGERSAVETSTSLASDRLNPTAGRWTSATEQDALGATRVLGHPRGIATPPRSATTSV